MESRRAALGAEPGREVEIDGVRLAYDDEGSGPALLCLHAVGHGARDYESFRARYRRRFRVVALDFPGHGRSSPDRHPASAERYAALLPRFLDAVGVDRAIVVGNSIGGAAALRLAAEHPSRVRALVVANPGGLFQRSFVSRASARLLARIFGAGARGAGWFSRLFAFYYARILTEAPAFAQRARIVAAASESAPVLEEAWRSFAAPSSDLRDRAPSVVAPVMVAWALRDPLNRLSFNRAGIARLPNATLETFFAGHSPFLETPREFDQAFERFLARVLDERELSSEPASTPDATAST